MKTFKAVKEMEPFYVPVLRSYIIMSSCSRLLYSIHAGESTLTDIPHLLIKPLCGLDLLLKDVLHGDSVSSELGNTLAELVHGHWLLVEVEAEESLVVNIAALGDVELGGALSVELLGDGGGGVVELLKEGRL